MLCKARQKRNQAHSGNGRTLWVDTCLKHNANGISVRIPSLSSFRGAHRGRCKLPQACQLAEVSKRQSCHAPTFNMDRDAPFSSHHRLTADSLFVTILSSDVVRSCLCSQVGGDVGGAYFTCALAGSLTFIVVRHHVSISAPLL